MKKEIMPKKDDFISVIMIAGELPKGDFSSSIRGLSQYLETYFFDYEILIIEDSPNQACRKILTSLLKEIASIRFIELAYKIDYEVAITVGLENSIGDFAIIFNPLQDPIDVILPMIEKCSTADNDVIVGVANNPNKSFGYKIIRPLVGGILAEIGYHIPKNATSLRCLSRNAINSATKARNYHHQIFVRIAQCGLASAAYHYDVKNMAKNRKGLFPSIKNALSLLVFNSTKPLRWMSMLGVLGSFLALIFAGYSFIIRLIYDNIADGWSSTVILISTLFMLLFIILSFFGEYLGRLLNEQSKHESYWITNEHNSSVMIDTKRQNVIENSDDT